jgi:hypothetical protein
MGQVVVKSFQREPIFTTSTFQPIHKYTTVVALVALIFLHFD